jgi:steroid delta-isomerase-like uncharacterized protein
MIGPGSYLAAQEKKMSGRSLFFVVALTSLTACKQSVETPAPAKPAMLTAPAPPPPPASKRIIADYMAAWNAHDAQLAGSFFADNAVYFDATMGAPQQGREAATENVIKVFMHAVPDSRWEISGEPIAVADGIAFEWTFSGKNTGNWAFGVAATNQRLNLHGVSFMRINNGKIVYEGNYYDGLTMNKQMGW